MNRRTRRTLTIAALISLVAIVTAVHMSLGAEIRRYRTKLGDIMVLIPGGEFYMGSTSGSADEKPRHKVKVSSFYMDTHPVTQEQYEALMGSNPSRWKNPDNPVEQVRWSDAVKYLNARSRAEGLEPCYDLKTWECDFGAAGYRLPTEAEWEYACRAGTNTTYFFGNSSSKLSSFAWYKSNSGGRPRTVGKKLPNPWGLYDIYGNVCEWCNDRYGRDYYEHSPSSNPRGPKSGKERVLRGGSWDSTAGQCTSSYRHKDDPGYADVCFGYDVYGFRAVRRVSR